MAQAVSLNGRLYTELPTAFQYRKALSSECSCRRPGESWSQALKAIGPDDTIVPGDVVVTEQNSKQLSRARNGVDGKPIRPDLRGTAPATAPTADPAPLAETAGQTDPVKRTVRTVGPTFLPTR
jgi:hypothetical protein